MYKEDIILQGESGLHARPASLLVKEAAKYSSNIKVARDGQEYNAKSIMGVLSMGATKGDKLTIMAEGQDEEEAVKALINLIKNQLNE